MAKHIFMAVSLDGYIADSNHSVDWLNAYPQEHGDDAPFTLFMQSIDAIIMGRKTFETVQSFGLWPYTKPVIVLSKTLQHLPDGFAGKASLSNASIEDLLSTMQAQGYEELYIDGGAVVQEFLARDLIDSMTLTHMPLLLGSGIPLFSVLERVQYFDHVHTQVLNGGLVMSGYLRKR